MSKFVNLKLNLNQDKLIPKNGNQTNKTEGAENNKQSTVSQTEKKLQTFINDINTGKINVEPESVISFLTDLNIPFDKTVSGNKTVFNFSYNNHNYTITCCVSSQSASDGVDETNRAGGTEDVPPDDDSAEREAYANEVVARYISEFKALDNIYDCPSVMYEQGMKDNIAKYISGEIKTKEDFDSAAKEFSEKVKANLERNKQQRYNYAQNFVTGHRYKFTTNPYASLKDIIKEYDNKTADLITGITNGTVDKTDFETKTTAIYNEVLKKADEIIKQQRTEAADKIIEDCSKEFAQFPAYLSIFSEDVKNIRDSYINDFNIKETDFRSEIESARDKILNDITQMTDSADSVIKSCINDLSEYKGADEKFSKAVYTVRDAYIKNPKADFERFKSQLESIRDAILKNERKAYAAGAVKEYKDNLLTDFDISVCDLFIEKTGEYLEQFVNGEIGLGEFNKLIDETYNNIVKAAQEQVSQAETQSTTSSRAADETEAAKSVHQYSNDELKDAYNLTDEDIKIYFKRTDNGYELNKAATESCFKKEINSVEDLLEAMKGELSIGYVYGAYSMGNEKYLDYLIKIGEGYGNDVKFKLNFEKIEHDFPNQNITTLGQLKEAVNNAHVTHAENTHETDETNNGNKTEGLPHSSHEDKVIEDFPEDILNSIPPERVIALLSPFREITDKLAEAAGQDKINNIINNALYASSILEDADQKEATFVTLFLKGIDDLADEYPELFNQPAAARTRGANSDGSAGTSVDVGNMSIYAVVENGQVNISCENKDNDGRIIYSYNSEDGGTHHNYNDGKHTSYNIQSYVDEHGYTIVQTKEQNYDKFDEVDLIKTTVNGYNPDSNNLEWTEINSPSDGTSVTEYYDENDDGKTYVTKSITEGLQTGAGAEYSLTVEYDKNGKKSSETTKYEDGSYHTDYFDGEKFTHSEGMSCGENGKQTYYFNDEHGNEVSNYTKDADGNLISEEKYDYESYTGDDGNEHWRVVSITTVEYRNGQTITTTHNNDENKWIVLYQSADGNNSVQEYEMINGEKVMTKEYIIQGDDVQKTYEYSYDDKGNLISKTEISYDENGVRIETTTFEDGRKPEVKYIGRDNKEISADDYANGNFNVNKGNDADSNVIDFGEHGDVLKHNTTPHGNNIYTDTIYYEDGTEVTIDYMEYNYRGEKVRIILNKVETISNDDGTKTVIKTTYEHGETKSIEIVDGKGNKTLEFFLKDKDGNTYSIKYVNGTLVLENGFGLADGEEVPVTSEGDTEVLPDKSIVIPQDVIDNFDIDKIFEEQRKDLLSPKNCTVTTNDNGEVVLTVEFKDGTWTQTFTENGYTVTWTSKEGGSYTDTYEKFPDGEYRVTNRERTDSDGDRLSTDLEYGKDGQVTNVSTTVIDKNGNEYIYQHDTKSGYDKTVETQNNADGTHASISIERHGTVNETTTRVTWDDNEPNSKVEETVERTYDENGNPVSITTVVYDSKTGRTDSCTERDGVFEVTTQTADGVISTIICTDANDIKGSAIAYSQTTPMYDDAGNVIGSTRSEYEMRNGQEVLTGTYTYDISGRMTTDTTYVYDEKGNVQIFVNEYLENGTVIQYKADKDGKLKPYKVITDNDGKPVEDKELLKETEIHIALTGLVNDLVNGKYGYGSNFNSDAFIYDWVRTGGQAFTFDGSDITNGFWNLIQSGASIDEIMKYADEHSLTYDKVTSPSGGSSSNNNYGGYGGYGNPYYGYTGYVGDGIYSFGDGTIGQWGNAIGLNGIAMSFHSNYAYGFYGPGGAGGLGGGCWNELPCEQDGHEINRHNQGADRISQCER